MRNRHAVYEGTSPYIFVSYSHKDSDRVLPLIHGLQDRGFRVWYDSGLEVGSEWHVDIANHLRNCECFVAFLTENYLASSNCQQEISYALQRKRKILPIYLEQVELTVGLDMQLSTIHALTFPKDMDAASFLDAIVGTKKLQDCHSTETITRETSAESQDSHPAADSATNDQESSHSSAHPFKSRLKWIIPVVLVVAVSVLVLLFYDEKPITPSDDKLVTQRGAVTKDNVVRVTFLDTLEDVPENSWDVSSDWGSQTMCWAYSVPGGYEVFLAADGGVIAPKDCSKLFYSCTNLEYLDCSGLDTSNVTNMFSMFAFCEKLETLDMSGFYTSNVTNMAYMFSFCKQLEALDVGRFVTSKVMNMSGMFDCCEKLETLDVDEFDTSNVTDMGWMFFGCSALTTPDISGWDLTKVSRYDYFMDPGVTVNGEPWEKLFEN